MNTVKKFVVFFLRLALYLVERFWVDEEWVPAPRLGIELALEQYSDEEEIPVFSYSLASAETLVTVLEASWRQALGGNILCISSMRMEKAG